MEKELKNEMVREIENFSAKYPTTESENEMLNIENQMKLEGYNEDSFVDNKIYQKEFSARIKLWTKENLR